MKKINIWKLIVSLAIPLIAALAWNDAIRAIFLKVAGTADTVLGMIIYAVVVTIIAVLVTIQIGRLSGR